MEKNKMDYAKKHFKYLKWGREYGEWRRGDDLEQLFSVKDKLDERILDVVMEEAEGDPTRRLVQILDAMIWSETDEAKAFLALPFSERRKAFISMGLFERLYSGWGEEAIAKERDILIKQLELIAANKSSESAFTAAQDKRLDSLIQP